MLEAFCTNRKKSSAVASWVLGAERVLPLGLDGVAELSAAGVEGKSGLCGQATRTGQNDQKEDERFHPVCPGGLDSQGSSKKCIEA